MQFPVLSIITFTPLVAALIIFLDGSQPWDRIHGVQSATPTREAPDEGPDPERKQFRGF